MTPLTAFHLLDLRAAPNEKAKKPAFKLWIDFGPLGVKQSSAQLTDLYTPADLPGRLVIAAVNLSPRTVAGFASEVLVLGLPDAQGRVALLTPDRDVPPRPPRLLTRAAGAHRHRVRNSKTTRHNSAFSRRARSVSDDPDAFDAPNRAGFPKPLQQSPRSPSS